MAIHGLCRPLPRRSLHDWSLYGGRKLAQAPLVRNLLTPHLRAWVECQQIENPLQINWVWTLYADAADSLERRLQGWSDEVGEGNFRATLSELPLGSTSASEVAKKLASIAEELQACKQLRAIWGAARRWDGAFADWTAGERIVSVKAPLRLDFNTDTLDDALLGAYSVLENRDLARAARRVEIREAGAISDRFRAALYAFFDDGLADATRAALSRAARGAWPGRQPQSEDMVWERSGHRLVIRVEPTDSDGMAFALLHGASVCGSRGTLRLVFSADGVPTDMLHVTLPDESWYGAPSPCNGGLARKIAEGATRLRKDFEGLGRPDSFLGWLSLAVHPKHELFSALSAEALQGFLRECLGPCGFEVAVCLHGGWELAQPRLVWIPARARV